MQHVVRVRPAGRGEELRAVTLTDGRRFLLEAREVVLLDLVPERSVDDALTRRLIEQDERNRARGAALLLLRYRPRSRTELATRLRRRFSAAVIQTLLDELATGGLVDDARFARVWAEQRVLQGNGPQRVRLELRKKGVAPALIDEVVQSTFGGQEADLAAAAAERQLRRLRRYPLDVRLRRLAGALRRRGFSGGVIAPLLRRHARPGDGMPPGDAG